MKSRVLMGKSVTLSEEELGKLKIIMYIAFPAR